MINQKDIDLNLKKVKFSSSNDIQIFTAKESFTATIDKKTPLSYRNPIDRRKVVAPPSTLHKLNYEDNLRRVSVIIHQHIRNGESLLNQYKNNILNKNNNNISGNNSNINNKPINIDINKINTFSEENFVLPQYGYHFIRAPITRIGFLYSIVPIKKPIVMPAVSDVLQFLLNIFVKANLTAECSIVCLIYAERLMEEGIPLVASTWRPCLLCALLLASKVWQDYGTWNVEFAEVYPQFTVKAINDLEVKFCEQIKFKLYVSTSLYAQYYFAIRSLAEKNDFRRKYNSTFLQETPDVAIIEENSKADFRRLLQNNNEVNVTTRPGIYSSSVA